MAVAHPVDTISNPADAAFAVERQTDLLHLGIHRLVGGVRLSRRLKQRDHVIAVAQVGAKLQLAPGKVVHRVERHVGHDLAAAGANWDPHAIAAVNGDEHPQQLQRALAFDVAVQLCKQRIVVDAVKKLPDVHAQVILPAWVAQMLLQLVAAAMSAAANQAAVGVEDQALLQWHA